LAVPDGVNEMLMCDHIVCRTYSDSLGRQVQVWVLFWANPASTANAHNPDICWPSRGWTLEKLEVKAVPLADGSGSLPVTRRRFRQGRQQQMLMYWSQKGTHVLTDASEADELFSYSAWVNALLRGGGPWEKSACFAVLVGTDYSGAPEPTERILQDFCGELAADLYRICPWAKPKDDALPGV
jgi:EpsI family protein